MAAAASFLLAPARPADRMPGAAQWIVLGGVVAAVHLAAAWALLQPASLRMPPVERKPLFVDWIAAPAPVPAPMPKPEPEPPRSPAVTARTAAAPPAPAPVRLPAPSRRPAALPPVAAVEAPQPARVAPPAAESPAPVPAVVEALSAAAASPAPAVSPAPVAAPAPAAQPRTVSATAVQYLVPPAPEYPAASSRLRETGTVVVQVLIGEDGTARELRLMRSSGHPRLDAAALAALRKARFRPYTEEGRALAVWAPAPIEFELEK